MSLDGQFQDIPNRNFRSLFSGLKIHPIIGILFGDDSDNKFTEFVKDETAGVIKSISSFYDFDLIIDSVREEICSLSGANINQYPTTIPPALPRMKLIFSFVNYFEKEQLLELEPVLVNILNDLQLGCPTLKTIIG